jgi:serine/threonine protein kinase
LFGLVLTQTIYSNLADYCTQLHEIALGMTYLHDAGVIHADLKGVRSDFVLIQSFNTQVSLFTRSISLSMTMEMRSFVTSALQN